MNNLAIYCLCFSNELVFPFNIVDKVKTVFVFNDKYRREINKYTVLITQVINTCWQTVSELSTASGTDERDFQK